MIGRWLCLSCLPLVACAADGASSAPVVVGIRVEIILFALILLGVTVLHRSTLLVAGLGVTALIAWRWGVTGFPDGVGLAGLARHLAHAWVQLANLFLLLTGFDLMAHHVSASRVPVTVSRLLPSGRLGAGLVLVLVFVLSGMVDNIAAAMIGAAIASTLFRGHVHVGYLVAIVAASNAGGAGSVIGDTTTTMVWLAGHSPVTVMHAYVGAIVALIVLAWFASGQQHRFQPMVAEPAESGTAVDWVRVVIVVLVLAAAIGTNLAMTCWGRDIASAAPWIGLSVWLVLLTAAPWRAPHWASLPHAATGAIFLLCLVLAASLMPVDQLPPAGMATTCGLGIVSAVVDNIPLTALALSQGGYDWGMLAFAVGFGGSMMWFGSSAGVAVASQFPQARSVGSWLRAGWYVPLAFAVGLLAMQALVGYHPDATGVRSSDPHGAPH